MLQACTRLVLACQCVKSPRHISHMISADGIASMTRVASCSTTPLSRRQELRKFLSFVNSVSGKLSTDPSPCIYPPSVCGYMETTRASRVHHQRLFFWFFKWQKRPGRVFLSVYAWVLGNNTVSTNCKRQAMRNRALPLPRSRDESRRCRDPWISKKGPLRIPLTQRKGQQKPYDAKHSK